MKEIPKVLVIAFAVLAFSKSALAVPSDILSELHIVRKSTNSPDKCAVKELRKSSLQGLRIYSPNRKIFLVNKEDAQGTAQIYIGRSRDSALSCITCRKVPGGPEVKRFKMQPKWHPNGKWIFLAVERDEYSPPPILGLDRNYVEGQLQSGLFTDMYIITPDGRKWFKMTDFKSGAPGVPDGYTGPAITNNGRRVVWSQIVDGNIFAYWPFGRWELIQADFKVVRGKPTFSNLKNITPSGMHWNEPGNFHPDNESLLLSGSTEKDAQGMDQYVLNIRSGRLRNLTNTPTVWDEHGLFSPNGKKIIFMSAYPYRSRPETSQILWIRTDFMLMNSNGSDLRQLTHFMEEDGLGYTDGHGMAATPGWNADGRSAILSRLFFPNYEYWDLEFSGRCGR